MLLNVLDADNTKRTIVVNGQGPATDASGTILQNDQTQIVAAANPSRSGCFFQNRGNNPMLINELGNATDPNAIQIGPGETWPPAGYPAPTSAIQVAGAQGDVYIYREW